MLTDDTARSVFTITDHVQFDDKGRAKCPSCMASTGKDSKKNLSLVPGTEGAYKCHRGCTPQQIRDALGVNNRPIPTAIAKPAANITVSPQKVKESCDRLLASNGPAKKWLHDRGINDGLIERYRIGISRAKVGNNQHVPAITIPIPAGSDGTQFYQKKRLAPWLAEADRPEGYKPWSQYGIPNTVWFTWLPVEAKQTYLCEGEWDAIQLGAVLASANAPIAVATFTSGAGNVPSKEQLELLPGEVVTFYDRNDKPLPNGDLPGEVGALKVAKAIGERAKIALVPMPDDCDVKGWDCSDAIAAGYGADDFMAAAAAATTPHAKESKSRVNPLKARMVKNCDLIARAADYIDWLVPDLLTPNELFILGTPPRTGKSLFCLTLAKAIASGGTFLDRPVTQGSVVYVNCEDGETKVKYRQTAQGWEQWGYDLPVYWFDEFKLSELADMQEVIEEIGDVRLLVLDTLTRVRDDNVKESSSEMGRILEPLQKLARDLNICVLVTHHVSKATLEDNADPFNMLRGNSSIRSTCRGAMVMLPDERNYRLICENGWSDQLDLKVQINSDTLEWRLLGNWNPRIDGDMKQQILDHLNLVGKSTIPEISQALGFNAGSVSTALYRLQREDMVTKHGGKGRQLAQYSRSANLCQQGLIVLGHQNPDTPIDTGLRQQNIKDREREEKVINSPKSDQSSPKPNDHFLKNDHFFEKEQNLLAQSCSPDVDSDSMRQQGDPLLALVGANCHTEKSSKDRKKGKIEIGSRVLYRGDSSSLQRVCQSKRLTVEAISDGQATVNYPGWAFTHTVPVTDLMPTRRQISDD